MSGPAVKKPWLTQKWEINSVQDCKMSFLLLSQGSSSSSASSSSTSLPKDSSSTSPSPARLRSDDTLSQASGNRSSKKKKKDNIQATRSRLRDLPEWLEEFTDYLENAEVPALANISEDSDPERPAKVATRKHSIFLTSRKTDTVKAAREPRLRGLLAGSALAKQYLGQKNSVC